VIVLAPQTLLFYRLKHNTTRDFSRMTKLSSTDSYLQKPEASKTHVEGALNFRSFGGYSSNVSQDAVTREGFIYRSGNLSSITNNGWEKIRELHISTIINLTDMDEAKALYANDAQRSERAKGFKSLHLPLNQKDFDKTSLFTKYCGYASEGYNVCLYFPLPQICVSNITAGHCSRLCIPSSRRTRCDSKHTTSDPRLPQRSVPYSLLDGQRSHRSCVCDSIDLSWCVERDCLRGV
jgi:hypothetical protein